MENKITFSFEILGSGTSCGVPCPGCRCGVCRSDDARDKRFRQAGLLRFSNGINMLIDCGTDIRTELLRTGLRTLDYILITHDHADHIHGLNDLVPFTKRKEIPIYLSHGSLRKLQSTYSFLFNGGMEAKGKFELKILNEKNLINGIEIVKVPVFHGIFEICGFRIGNLAYLTDVSRIPDESYDLLKGVEYLFIDGLCNHVHPSHFSYGEALDEIEKIRPKYAWLIHVTHNETYAEIEDFIQKQYSLRPGLDGITVHSAYDGLVIENLICYSI